jgi:predicted anti-sigma-YlaC factor YlaD
MLSAQLDGEDDPAGRPLVDEHLAACAGCRRWLDDAATVNRLTRTGVGFAPDLSAAILAALPGTPPARGDRAVPARRRGRGQQPAEQVGPPPKAGVLAALLGAVSARAGLVWRRIPVAALLYVALAVVGAVQLILGLSQVGGGAGAHDVHAGLNATPGHLWHESAAWNVAVGAGYLFIALRRSRPSGLVPMLTAFVGMLLLLSINDLTGDRVDGTRLISHGFVLAGYLLVVTLSRIPGGFGAPPAARSGWRVGFPDDEPEHPAVAAPRPGLRLVPRGPMTAKHEERRAA